MKKWTLLILILFIIPLSIQSAKTSRGLTPVKVQDKSGQQVTIYNQSHALIVGVSSYKHWNPLPGVKEDVLAVKAALEDNGFNVLVKLDPESRDELENTFKGFIKDYGRKKNNRLLFYYAGHGHSEDLAYGGKMGYILPANTPLPTKDRDGFFDYALDMEQIETYAKRIQAKHALFMFDSCFSGELFNLSRAAPAYITEKTGMPIRQFITSGSADQEVPDKSEFRRQFVEAINGEADEDKDGFLTASELGNFLHKQVTNYSYGSQTPQYGKIRHPNLDKGDFVFTLNHSRVTTTTLPLRLPGESSAFSLEDLEARAAKLEQAKTAWANKQSQMQSAYDQLQAFEDRSIPPADKATAWNRFLSAFNENNPHSSQDESLRQQGQQRLSHWQEQDRKEKAAKQSQKQQAAVAVPPSSGELYTEPNTGMEFKRIASDSFRMGDLNGGGGSDEKQVRTVRISKDFRIMTHEVTVEQYKKCVDAGACQYKGDTGFYDNWGKPGRGKHPINAVSWNDGQDFITWLNNQGTGKTYRYCTEAEWEYAARAGTETKWSCGNDESCLKDVAWYSTNAWNVEDKGTREFKTKKPNPWGLYDMHGNVWEWVQDWKDPYSTNDITDPQGPDSGSFRVIRGGDFRNNAVGLRSALRYFNSPDFRYFSIGLRLCSSL